MKFCSECGSSKLVLEIPEGDVHRRYICRSCHKIHYTNPKVITGCLPVWEDKVLLATRAIGPKQGFWNVPAGFMENGETVEEGAAREVFEETGAKVNIKQLISLYSIPRINQVYMHFWGEMETPYFYCGIESEEVKLFTEEDIPWDKIAFSSSVFTLRNYFSDRKKGIFSTHTGELELNKLT